MSCSSFYLPNDMANVSQWSTCGNQLFQDGMETVTTWGKWAVNNTPSTAEMFVKANTAYQTAQKFGAETLEKIEANRESWKNDTTGLRDKISIGIAIAFTAVTLVSLTSICKKGPQDRSPVKLDLEKDPSLQQEVVEEFIELPYNAAEGINVGGFRFQRADKTGKITYYKIEGISTNGKVLAKKIKPLIPDSIRSEAESAPYVGQIFFQEHPNQTKTYHQYVQVGELPMWRQLKDAELTPEKIAKAALQQGRQGGLCPKGLLKPDQASKRRFFKESASSRIP